RWPARAVRAGAIRRAVPEDVAKDLAPQMIAPRRGQLSLVANWTRRGAVHPPVGIAAPSYGQRFSAQARIQSDASSSVPHLTSIVRQSAGPFSDCHVTGACRERRRYRSGSRRTRSIARASAAGSPDENTLADCPSIMFLRNIG